MYLYEDDLRGIGSLAGLAGGIGVIPEMPAKLTPRQAAINKTRIIANRLVAQNLLAKQKLIAKRLGMPSSTIGGMGHMISRAAAILSADGPWYNPGADHRARHDGKSWPTMPLPYAPDVVANVRRLNNMSQYDIEHMSPALFKRLAEKARAGVAVVPDGKPTPSPTAVAVEAAKQEVIDRTAGAATTVVDTAKAGYEAAANAVQKTGQAAVDVFKYPFELVNKFKWYILGGVGLVGLFVAWPYISAARGPGKALQKKFG